MLPVKPAKGFTLLEIMIAIAVFSVLSMAAYQVLQGVMRSDELSRNHSDDIKQLQRAMLIIEKDMTQMVARTIRNGGGPGESVIRAGKYIAESESDGIDFVRLGWSNPKGQLPRSNLLRVAYRVREDKLERLYFLYPDSISGQEPESQVLIEGVNSLKLRYWKSSWQETWTEKDTLPAGVAFELELEKYGKISRLFLTPVGSIVKEKPQVPDDPSRVEDPDEENGGSENNDGNDSSGGNNGTGGGSLGRR
ncbi:type II secretion system minor pseudopilin GspJ [Motilimonas pumila]|uniref:Type II secretion system protein J n=1 Tax=Motilimonas pumila TaxID=2303987 RepID=A0A418YKW5_9GAMM|nr:type II secretion system minor pseudopilin GspJ [Motilimonas pumila]RJG51616.1 type II secretion system protein GspJ [Motilimonas pumila]